MSNSVNVDQRLPRHTASNPRIRPQPEGPVYPGCPFYCSTCKSCWRATCSWSSCRTLTQWSRSTTVPLPVTVELTNVNRSLHVALVDLWFINAQHESRSLDAGKNISRLLYRAPETYARCFFVELSLLARPWFTMRLSENFTVKAPHRCFDTEFKHLHRFWAAWHAIDKKRRWNMIRTAASMIVTGMLHDRRMPLNQVHDLNGY